MSGLGRIGSSGNRDGTIGNDVETNMVNNSNLTGDPKTDESTSTRDEKKEQNVKSVQNQVVDTHGHDVKDQIFLNVNIEQVSNDRTNENQPPSTDRTGLHFHRDLSPNQVRQKDIFCCSTNDTGQVFNISGKGALNRMFKCELSDDQIRGLGGIPDSDEVFITKCEKLTKNALQPDPSQQAVTIEIREGDGPFSELRTTVYLDLHGKVNVFREDTRVKAKSNPPSNLGGCALIRQIHMARQLGVNVVHNVSIRVDGSANGYNTWARYGGNARLLPVEGQDRFFADRCQPFLQALKDPGTAFGKVRQYALDYDFPFKDNDGRDLTQEKFEEVIGQLDRQALSVQDLMQTGEGRALWRVFGFSIPLTFDLHHDSPSMKTLREYGGKQCCFDLEKDF